MDPTEVDKEEVNHAKQDSLLKEKDFIQENPLLRSSPVWIGIFIVSLLIISIMGTYNWYLGRINQQKFKQPFQEVTNREFSVFLWQFPIFLRKNSSVKTGYLPGFKAKEEGVELNAADENVIAPPDLIFLYHTWNRLFASEYIPRPISPELFEEFLNQNQEWLPSAWRNAPKSYIEMINLEAYKSMPDLQAFNESELPLIVRQSFQGWKNYFKEGVAINALHPTFDDLKEFLDHYPHYGRSYWRNIDVIAKQPVGGKNYLSNFLRADLKEGLIPQQELSPFLKVALFNAQQATE